MKIRTIDDPNQLQLFDVGLNASEANDNDSAGLPIYSEPPEHLAVFGAADVAQDEGLPKAKHGCVGKCLRHWARACGHPVYQYRRRGPLLYPRYAFVPAKSHIALVFGVRMAG